MRANTVHPLWKIYEVPHPYWECDDLPSLEKQKHTTLPFCYIIKIVDMDYCKVGSTGNIRSRLNGYKVGLPFELGLIFAISAGTDGEHIMIERKAHSMLSPKKVRGEWFNCTAYEAIDAVRQAAVWTEEFMK